MSVGWGEFIFKTFLHFTRFQLGGLVISFINLT